MVLSNLELRILSALKILIILEDFNVSSTKENKLPNSSWAFIECFFKLFPTQEIIPPMIGKINKENSVNLGESANKVISEETIINGALITSTKLPIIEFSTFPTSLEILLIISPFLCSVKKDTGNFKNL